LTFVLDPELTLLFPNEVMLEQWRRGIEHAMVLLMRPDGGALGLTSLHNDSLGGQRGGGTTALTGVLASTSNASDVDSQLEEGMLRILGMNIRRIRKPFSKQQQQQQQPTITTTMTIKEDGVGTPPIISRTHSTSGGTAEVQHPSSTGTPDITPIASLARTHTAHTPTTAAAATIVENAGQILKRQRMAAFLSSAAAATVGRLQSTSGKMPFSAPLSSSTAPGAAASSPGSARVFFPWLRTSASPAAGAGSIAATKQYSDDEEYDASFREGGGSLRRKKRRGALVSVGTQTDDLEIEIELSYASVDREIAPATNTTVRTTTGTITSDEENAYLASGYAELMAAAAAAASSSSAGGGGGGGGFGFGGGSTTSHLITDNGEFGVGRKISETPPALAPLPQAGALDPSRNTPSPLGALAVSIPESLTGASNVLNGVNFGGGIRSPTGMTLATTPGTPSALSPTTSASAAALSPSGQLAISVDVVDYEELSMGKLLGAGSEGAVYAAWYLETPVAVKRFNRVEDSLHEVAMYLGVGSHDNVVALRALCQHESAMYLVLEYCPR
jgi:hypothetical protein